MTDNPSYQDFATHDESAYPELWDGCVGAWAPCLGPSGLRLQDNSGRQNWGTLTNMDAATDWVVDGGRYALDFDGSNDFADMELDKVSLPADFSYFGWAYFRGASVNSVLWVRRTGGLSLIYFSSATSLFFRSESPSTISVFTIPSILNKWSFVGLSRINGNLRCFIDGKLIQSFTNAGGLLFDRLAANAGGGLHVNALIDDQCFLNRACSASEILDRYRIGRGGMYTPRRRRKAYFLGPSFNAAWARGSNVILQPSVGVA